LTGVLVGRALGESERRQAGRFVSATSGNRDKQMIEFNSHRLVQVVSPIVQVEQRGATQRRYPWS
jgi:hypothetical protein